MFLLYLNPQAISAVQFSDSNSVCIAGSSGACYIFLVFLIELSRIVHCAVQKIWRPPLHNILHYLAAAQHPISLNTCCFSVTSVTTKAAALRGHIPVAKGNQTGLYCGPACSFSVFLKRPLLPVAWNTAVKVSYPCLNLTLFWANRITATISLNVSTTGTSADSFTPLYPQSKIR